MSEDEGIVDPTKLDEYENLVSCEFLQKGVQVDHYYSTDEEVIVQIHALLQSGTLETKCVQCGSYFLSKGDYVKGLGFKWFCGECDAEFYDGLTL